MALLGLCVGGFALAVHGQSSPPVPSRQDENPFPGVPAKADGSPNAPVNPAGQAPAKPVKPGTDNDNPFPGDVPGGGSSGIPVDSIPASGASSSAAGDAARRSVDPDGDPVASPDGATSAGDDGFSSSRSGVTHLPAEDDTDSRPGKSAKVKSREQVIKEDLDVGSFYLGLKNWKGAQLRFSAAFALDAENPTAAWGLGEAERHLNLNKEATEHLKLFLSYDPEGPHSKEARKALDQLEAMPPSASTTPAALTPGGTIAPK